MNAIQYTIIQRNTTQHKNTTPTTHIASLPSYPLPSLAPFSFNHAYTVGRGGIEPKPAAVRAPCSSFSVACHTASRSSPLASRQ